MPTRPTSGRVEGRVLAIGGRVPLPGRKPEDGNWRGRPVPLPMLGRVPVPMLGRLTPVLGRLTDGRLTEG